MPSRTIRPTEAPVSAPYTYTVTAPDGFTPDAVFASWDGAGAAGDFLPCVSFYNADGVLMDRAFPPGVTLHPGDTADASYRPFDRSGGATAPAPVTGFEAINGGNGVLVVPNVFTLLPWFKDFGDDLLGFIGTTAPTINAAGTYAITAYASGGVAPGPYNLTMQFRFPKAGGTFQSFVTAAPGNSATISGAGPSIGITKPFAVGDALDVHVAHDATANVLVSLLGTVALNP